MIRCRKSVQYGFLKSREFSQLTSISKCGVRNNIFRITMNAPPVNSLGIELINSLKASFNEASSAAECEGIILASSARVFSAGLNMTELHGSDIEFLNKFWTNFQGNNVMLFIF